jgi:hypothetical protein
MDALPVHAIISRAGVAIVNRANCGENTIAVVTGIIGT